MTKINKIIRAITKISTQVARGLSKKKNIELNFEHLSNWGPQRVIKLSNRCYHLSTYV